MLSGPAARCTKQRSVFLILGAMLALQVYGAWRTGVTIDEPSHLLSAYLYWRGADRLPPSDVPPLMKIVTGWAPNLFGLPVPGNLGHEGDTRHEWHTSTLITGKLTAEAVQRLFFTARLPMLLFPALTGWLIWRWGRELYSPFTAVILVLLFVIEPTALAHGSLLKNDLAATLGYLFFWYRTWRYWKSPGWQNAAWIGLATLTGCMTKMSMLILLALGPSIILLRRLTDRTSGFRAVAISLILSLLIPYAGAIAAYQFELHWVQESFLDILAANPKIPKAFLTFANLFRIIPVPKNMWQGTVSLFMANSSPATVYMNGKVWPSGHPLYFLTALAVKVPVALQLLLAAGLALLLVRLWRRKLEVADLFWILPGFLYIFMASQSQLQLGVRLVLPALPFGLFIAGAAVEWLREARRKWVLAGLVVLTGVESLRLYPHGIAFFNAWVGGPSHGLRYLADSNLDWGQSLRDLARYVEKNNIGRFRLAYFGADNPRNYFSADQMEMVLPPWDERFIKGTQFVPQPGIYAVSATLLPGHFFSPGYRRYFSAFWNRTPIAKVGYSIYIYRID